MPAARSNLATKAQRIAAHATKHPDGERRAGDLAERTRLSVDVTPIMAQTLARALPDLAVEAKVRRVRQSEVVRALLEELDADPKLRAKIVKRLREASS